jgi:hypothetical protein
MSTLKKDSGSHEWKRKIANNWRCIAFAIENDVPKELFILTNYDRMGKNLEKRMTNGPPDSETETESQSESSTFDDVLDAPIVNIPVICSYPVDSNLFENEASAPQAPQAPQAPKKKPQKKSKKRKRKKKGSSSGQPVPSK